MTPELLEVRAAPGGGIAALMLGAAWFGFGHQTEESQSKRSQPGDRIWDLLGAAYLSDQSFHVPRSIAPPEPPGHLSISFYTKPSEAGSSQGVSSEQLAAARETAVEMVSGAVDSVVGESFSRSNELV